MNSPLMNKKNKLIVAGLGLVQFAFCANNVLAQEVKTLEEVVIAATKNEQKQSQTGKVVTMISSEELANSVGKNLAELLNQQAGITIGGVGSNAGKDKSLFFRGAGSAYAVILIDGVLASDPSGAGGSFDLRMLSIDQIERIELLKGGQSTLYGSDAVAGVVNIIMKKSTKKGHQIYGVASVGSYQAYKGTLGLSSTISDYFSYNIGYTYFKTDGISEAENPEGDHRVFDKDGLKQGALNANLNINLAKNLTIKPFVRYFYGKFKYDDNAFTDANNQSETKYFNTGLNGVYELAKGKITLNYSHQNTERIYESAYPARYEGRMNLIDVYYNQNLTKHVNLLVGLDNRATSVVKESTANLFSTYASVFLHDLKQVNLEIGGRYNQHNKYGENFTYTLTPSINLTEEVKVFATASSAFRAPTLSMLFGQYGANPFLKPELSVSYEAGATLSFFKKLFNLRVVGFKRNVTDAIIYGNNGYINQDEQKDKGFEIEPTFKLNKLDLKTYYAYVEGKQFAGANVSNFLLRRPKHTLGLNIGVQTTDNLYLSANYKFTGKRIDSDFSTYPAENKSLKAYHLVDVYAAYTFKSKAIKIFADLKNLTNEKYVEMIGYRTMGFNVNTGISFSLNK